MLQIAIAGWKEPNYKKVEEYFKNCNVKRDVKYIDIEIFASIKSQIADRIYAKFEENPDLERLKVIDEVREFLAETDKDIPDSAVRGKSREVKDYLIENYDDYRILVKRMYVEKEVPIANWF